MSKNGLVHTLFWQTALKFGDRIAATSGDEEITYECLAGSALALAERLVAVGVGPDIVVGLHAERSLDMMVAMVAVMMAGGAFMFLDPAYPDERLAFMIEDSGARLVLAPQGECKRYHGLAAEVFAVDRRSAQPAYGTSARFPHHPTLDPDNLAYVVFTSGSTGRPKAAAITHRNLVSFLQSRNLIDHAPGDVVLGIYSLCFDGSIFEIWGAFACGATLALYRARSFDLVELVRLITDRGATAAFLTPALFCRLFEYNPALAGRFRRLWVGGETVRSDMISRFLAIAPQCRVMQIYGPTEATSMTMRHICSPEYPRDALLPLGEGVGETVVVVLDDLLREVAPGGEGELYLAGPQIGRGYYRRPGLTATRFIASPGGSRYYRTGDRVRLTPAGEILYLGRVDRQIKLRGFRIEPGEVEAAIERETGSLACAVTMRHQGDGAPRLVAYLTAHAPIDIPALCAALLATLPTHMVPVSFVQLDALPMNANGKIDYDALPDPFDTVDPGPTATPSTPTETLIVELCRNHLGAPKLSVNTDLFAAGLDSLGAARIAARVRADLGKEVPLRAIFEHRTICALATWIDKQAVAPVLETPAVGALADSPVRLSFTQESLLFLDRLGRIGSAYNLAETISLTGDLDRSALSRALQALVDRHPLLRAIIGAGQAGPELRVGAAWPAFESEDLRLDGLSPAAARVVVQEFVERPYDLAAGPLFRVGVGRFGVDRHWLVLAMHHIVSDGWSLQILFRDLARLYHLACRGQPLPGPDGQGDYRDYVAWQRAWLDSPDFVRQLDYWRSTMESAPPVLSLPTDYPRPAEISHRGAMHSFSVSARTTARLASLAACTGTTLYTVLLAAYLVMLGRWSGQSDLVVATPVAGRDLPEFETLVGLFVNMLPIRVQTDGNLTVGALIARVRDAALGAFENASLPFGRLVDALRPERSLSSHVLAQVSFTKEIPTDSEREWSPLVAVTQPIARSDAILELSLYVTERPDGIHAYFGYATDLFGAATVARMADSWIAVLDAFETPERPIAALPCLSAVDWRLLTCEWGIGPRPGDTLALHRVLDRQAEASPARVALRSGAENITYGELASRSAQLARHLRKLGAGRDVLVGLCLERSVDMIVALFAILKAGAAFVPLDPDDPPTRLASMIKKAGLALIIARKDVIAQVSSNELRVIDPNREADAIARENDAPLRLDCDPDQLAYVMFTSGSTGEPKGVAVCHGGLANIIAHQRAAHNLTPEDRVLQFARLCFDLSVWDVALAVGAGASLVLLPLPVPLGRALAAFIDHMAVSVVSMTPSMLSSLEGYVLGSVRLMIVGGEICPLTAAQRWQPGRRFINFYGPTECSIAATFHNYGGGDEVPIGAAFEGVRVYVLDGWLELSPIGTEGELYIGGENVGRGYLGRPGLTAERFIADPFTPGARLYRTGDRARWRPDGELIFLGRTDHQVKLRGYRIELGEIESTLNGFDGVVASIATVRDQGSDASQLVAYVVLRPGANVARLRDSLAQTLPAHMVPSSLVAVSELPMTPNGKIDRAALAQLAMPSHSQDSPALETTSTEVRLIEILGSLLGRQSLSINDNFFDIGANSLILARFANMIEQRLGIAVEMVFFFRNPTIAALAQLIDGRDHADDDDYTTAQDDSLDRVALARRRRAVRASSFVAGDGDA